MILLEIEDFEDGKYVIPDSTGYYTEDTLQEAIDNFEKKYIYLLLGVTLGNLIIAYLAANRTPANTDYNKIIDAFAEDISSGTGSQVQSLGMKEYVKAGVFYEYVKNGLRTSQAGVSRPDAETAQVQDPGSVMRFAENKFNDILDTVEAIQWYCQDNQSAFPDYNGKAIKVKASNIF